MSFYSYKIGEGAVRTLNRLLPRVQKQNCAAAAVMMLGKTPILRRGQGGGKLIRLDVEMWIRQDVAETLSFHWTNKEETQPLLLAFSFRGCVESSKALKPEDLVIFAPNSEEVEQVQMFFVTGDANTQARGYVYAVEEGTGGSQIAWLIFIDQTQDGNHTVVRFGSPEAFAPLSELVLHGMHVISQDLSENTF